MEPHFTLWYGTVLHDYILCAVYFLFKNVSITFFCQTCNASISLSAMSLATSPSMLPAASAAMCRHNITNILRKKSEIVRSHWPWTVSLKNERPSEVALTYVQATLIPALLCDVHSCTPHSGTSTTPKLKPTFETLVARHLLIWNEAIHDSLNTVPGATPHRHKNSRISHGTVAIFYGTLGCRGTPVEKHWPTLLTRRVSASGISNATMQRRVTK